MGHAIYALCSQFWSFDIIEKGHWRITCVKLLIQLQVQCVIPKRLNAKERVKKVRGKAPKVCDVYCDIPHTLTMWTKKVLTLKDRRRRYAHNHLTPLRRNYLGSLRSNHIDSRKSNNLSSLISNHFRPHKSNHLRCIWYNFLSIWIHILVTWI
jgi:hypothetical protein